MLLYENLAQELVEASEELECERLDELGTTGMTPDEARKMRGQIECWQMYGD